MQSLHNAITHHDAHTTHSMQNVSTRKCHVTSQNAIVP
jgi:hypothetical protein